jgi:hypothetical protein
MSVDVSISVRRLERIFRPSIFPAIRTRTVIPRTIYLPADPRALGCVSRRGAFLVTYNLSHFSNWQLIRKDEGPGREFWRGGGLGALMTLCLLLRPVGTSASVIRH